MAAIEYVDFAGRDDLGALVERIKARRRGTLPNVYRLLLHSPAVTQGWVGLADAVRFDSQLDDATRELVILLVAHLTDCDYEWAHHGRIAARIGVPAEHVAALRQWPDLSGVRSGDIRLLTIAGAMAARTSVRDLGVDWSPRDLDPALVIEAQMTAAYYLGLAHLIVALEVDHD
jgi:AhpD family alkylhydroperoxidase